MAKGFDNTAVHLVYIGEGEEPVEMFSEQTDVINSGEEMVSKANEHKNPHYKRNRSDFLWV